MEDNDFSLVHEGCRYPKQCFHQTVGYAGLDSGGLDRKYQFGSFSWKKMWHRVMAGGNTVQEVRRGLRSEAWGITIFKPLKQAGGRKLWFFPAKGGKFQEGILKERILRHLWTDKKPLVGLVSSHNSSPHNKWSTEAGFWIIHILLTLFSLSYQDTAG